MRLDRFYFINNNLMDPPCLLTYLKMSFRKKEQKRSYEKGF